MFGRGLIIAIGGIIVILVIIFLLTTTGANTSTQGIPAATCADKAVAYANSNLVQAGSKVSFVSVNESKGLYDVQVLYQSKQITLYTNKECSLLFTSSYDMDAPVPTPVPTPTLKKTARPVADLYVMAFCPYGTQAESTMQPVVDLLGNKADIRIRYITSVSGTTAGSVSSLHGPAEAHEDLIQVCVRNTDPGKYWQYLTAFNAQCYPQWQNATFLDTCRKNVSATLGFDSDCS